MANTQHGIAAAIGSSQSPVSRVLRRLAAVDVVRIERSHVHGGARVVKVYFLTRRGERLAREIAEGLHLSLLPEMGGFSQSNRRSPPSALQDSER